jgi:DNA-binding MarR family transcriptional regulator
LVTKLVGNGLLIRAVDEADRRACQLRLAEPTQQIVDASRAARRVLLSEALEDLDNDQIDSLTKGLEVLNTVTRRLQERGS